MIFSNMLAYHLLLVEFDRPSSLPSTYLVYSSAYHIAYPEQNVRVQAGRVARARTPQLTLSRFFILVSFKAVNVAQQTQSIEKMPAPLGFLAKQLEIVPK